VGAEAHSDGDALLHAFSDAVYGALGRGDIGEHFPDSDPRWKGRESRFFLEHALGLAREAGYRLVNVDATVILEEVKLSPHKPRIVESLREILGAFWSTDEVGINVKAKTHEKCDAVGRGEAIVAHVLVLLREDGP
jgi:2-C-methyl-D-erythritol 2,4-cyclodiphosphate synthase